MPNILEEILDARENRTRVLKSKLENSEFVTTLSLNIPGANKTGQLKKNFIQKCFYEYLSMLKKLYENINYDFFEDAAGYIYFIEVSKGHPYQVKQIALDFEDILGKHSSLVDIDVYVSLTKKITRENLAKLPRVCLMCSEFAKNCAFKQTHPIEELEKVVDELLKTEISFSFSKEYIMHDIIKDVSEGILSPNDRLKEIDLSNKYNVSRTKIREVISTLAEYGLLVVRKDMGVIIKKLTYHELTEVIELRKCAKLIIFKDIFTKITNKDHRVVVEKVLEYLEGLDRANYDLLKKWNQEFYDLLFSVSDKYFTKNLFNKFEILFSNVRYLISKKAQDYFYVILDQHINICKALLTKDYEDLVKSIELYFTDIQRIMLQVMDDE
ncbi:hypothetical protein SHELI_v1c10410 [Spiroplasma helicoides]|uniref:citrate lyase holo-[acyl-carrier protein] synthase n=1 Tax=Spiroplasma helicoides TaxID=216938 RepID=A0A1B3SM31_9MOLU|nr:citrate lyase holo-[acyl-carrier protein] synthase [Spiroplasma helicoides]AOG60988.1 hypothetical protein SHELI_v1c10410 [Spiroplasma helicoides]